MKFFSFYLLSCLEAVDEKQKYICEYQQSFPALVIARQTCSKLAFPNTWKQTFHAPNFGIDSVSSPPPHQCILWPPVSNYMLLYSTLLCKKLSRAPGGHKKFMLTNLGEQKRSLLWIQKSNSNVGSFLFVPPASLVGAYYLHPPDARAIFSHYDILCKGTCSAIGGPWRTGGVTNGKDPKFLHMFF